MCHIIGLSEARHVTRLGGLRRVLIAQFGEFGDSDDVTLS